jgi:membrane protein DedA with SNARE-associated domain
VVRTFIALPAGIARMPMGKFQLYTFIGSWPWCFALAYVGEQLGSRWDSDPELRATFHRFDAVIVGVMLLLVVWYVVRHWKHRMGAED